MLKYMSLKSKKEGHNKKYTIGYLSSFQKTRGLSTSPGKNGILKKEEIDWGVIMRVKCVICDKIESIEDETLMAKRLRNRPIHTYMCKDCNERIKERTNARIETGNFRLYRAAKNEDNW